MAKEKIPFTEKDLKLAHAIHVMTKKPFEEIKSYLTDPHSREAFLENIRNVAESREFTAKKVLDALRPASRSCQPPIEEREGISLQSEEIKRSLFCPYPEWPEYAEIREKLPQDQRELMKRNIGNKNALGEIEIFPLKKKISICRDSTEYFANRDADITIDPEHDKQKIEQEIHEVIDVFPGKTREDRLVIFGLLLGIIHLKLLGLDTKSRTYNTYGRLMVNKRVNGKFGRLRWDIKTEDKYRIERLDKEYMDKEGIELKNNRTFVCEDC